MVFFKTHHGFKHFTEQSLFQCANQTRQRMMKLLIICLFFISSTNSLEGSFTMNPEVPTGIWLILDEETGETRSEVEFYKKGNRLFARILNVKEGHENARCKNCPGELNGARLKGMNLIWDLQWDGSRWSGGSIIDVDDAKVYNCRINSFDQNTVEIRGYIGRPIFGRTVQWIRKQE